MAVFMSMLWEGVTPAQYDQVRNIVDWEGKPADGGLFHVAGFDEQGLHVTDIWETPDAFRTFVDERLMPGVQQVGIQSQPKVEIFPLHASFLPGYKRI
jgi:hypothetical protein